MISALLGSTLLLAGPATAQSGLIVDPAGDANIAGMDTYHLTFNYTPKNFIFLVEGDYKFTKINRIDLSIHTKKWAKCWDLTSNTPHRLGVQGRALWGAHCGNSHKLRCHKASITTAKVPGGDRTIRFVIPQRCLGKPGPTSLSPSFSLAAPNNLYSQIDVTEFIRRG